MLTSATEEDFTAFQTTYGYSVTSTAGPLLALSFAFMQSLPWCKSDQENHESITLAQCFIAYAMSAEGGGFNPSARVDGVVVKSEQVGTLEQEFMFNPNVESGSSSFSQLKLFPIAYGLLSSFLCENAAVDPDRPVHRASVYIV